METKTCIRCGETYESPSEHFHKNKQSKGGLHPYCKKCRNEQRKDYYEMRGRKLSLRRYHGDPAYQLMFNLKERGYQSMTRGKLNKKLNEYAISSSGQGKLYKCGYCGRTMTETGTTGGKRDLSIDHLVPYSLYKHINKDIDHNLENLVVTCQFCNRSKSDILFSEWYPKQATAKENIFKKYIKIENEMLRKIGGEND